MKLPANTIIAAAALLAAASCSGNRHPGATKTNDDTAVEDMANAGLRGRWYIENIVFSDSDYVRPQEATPGIRHYITFSASTYHIQTNCNSISGAYAVAGDSITLTDGAMTEKACDNMTVEDALRRMLPEIATAYIGNDSIARLDSSNPTGYIVLHKENTTVK